MKKDNIFTKSKETQTKPKSKENELISINIQGEEFAEKLTKYINTKHIINELNSELEKNQKFIKEIGINEYAKLVENKKMNVGSFNIISDNDDHIMISPTKKYIKIDESSAEILQEKYGENIITENTKYVFNTKILLKYMDIISDLIQNSPDISESDKENLIEANTTYNINKNTLDKIYTLAQKTKTEVLDVINDIQPVIMLKSAKT